MSRRTSEANKAIAAAWTNEQQLVLEGKGTRDWTPEQQQDILDRGKVYDDNGKAFEGHHMKSAEKFPYYQGNPQNIQFLSRTEHFAAHSGNFQNPTNGFYNPIKRETLEFSLERIEPCEVIGLTTPVIKISNVERDLMDSPDQKTNVSETDKDNVNLYETTPLGNTTDKAIVDTPKLAHHNTSKINTGSLGKNITQVAGAVQRFGNQHPILIQLGKIAGVTAVSVVSNKVVSNGSKSKSKTTYSNSTFKSNLNTKPLTTQVTDIIERSSPTEHMVKPHKQRYNGVWKDIAPYSRGKNKDN